MFDKEHIQIVLDAIKQSDSREYEILPTDFVTVLDINAELVYTRKLILDVPEILGICYINGLEFGDVVVLSCNEYGFEKGFTVKDFIKVHLF